MAYKDLCHQAYGSTAYNHRALLPRTGMSGFPQPKHTEQASYKVLRAK